MERREPRIESVYDRLVQGTVDLHCHVDVEFSRTLFRKAAAEWEWLPEAEQAGTRAVVLKSHLWPTVSVVPFIEQLYDGPVEVFGSVTLNTHVGGLDPWAVEVAAHLGARAVFMPTWSSLNDAARGGFGRRLGEAFEHFDHQRMGTLSVLGDDDRLTDAAQEVIRLVASKEMMLSTGHLSWQESLAIAEEAKRIGFERVLCGHPLSGSVGAPREAVRRAAELGAYVEFCWPTVAPGRHDPAEVVALVEEIGASRVVFTSDYFGGSNPSPSALMRMLLGAVHDAGLAEESIRRAAATNPAELLGLSPR